MSRNLWLAIDPGTDKSGYVLYRNGTVLESGILVNGDMIAIITASYADELAIEMIASYGMAVGQEVFETCVWIGRFMQTWGDRNLHRIPRREVKLHLCGSMRAKDTNVWQALLDKLGPVGTKATPGPLYGVKSHARAALALAVAADETMGGYN